MLLFCPLLLIVSIRLSVGAELDNTFERSLVSGVTWDLPAVEIEAVYKELRSFSDLEVVIESKAWTQIDQVIPQRTSSRTLVAGGVDVLTYESNTSFTCQSMATAYTPFAFCSGVVDYPFLVPAGGSSLSLELAARAAASIYNVFLNADCLADVKRAICASIYLRCVENGTCIRFIYFYW
jgi:hypothetical protein